MKLFVGGSQSIRDITDLPNRRILDSAIYYIDEILVGDAPGADAAFQKYLARRGFDCVTVYASGKKARNNVGGWEVKQIEYDPALTGYDFYRQKDIAMILDCNRALMAWDGKSKGTRQNIIDLAALGKRVDNMFWKTDEEEAEWYYLDGTLFADFVFGPEYFIMKDERDRKALKHGWSPLLFPIWLDDLRPAPEGYFWCRSVNEAKLCIETAERYHEKISVIDCDHDLGIYAKLGGDGIKLLDWLAERETYYPVELHTMNPVGRENMQRILDRFWPR